VLDGELVPVAGFRDYASLSVGEAVFTIGLQIQRHLRTLNPINFRTIVPMIADSWR
jgi:hypothetical protein